MVYPPRIIIFKPQALSVSSSLFFSKSGIIEERRIFSHRQFVKKKKVLTRFKMRVSFGLVAIILLIVFIQSSEVSGQSTSKKCYELSPGFVKQFKCGKQFHIGTGVDIRVFNSNTTASIVKRGEYPWWDELNRDLNYLAHFIVYKQECGADEFKKSNRMEIFLRRDFNQLRHSFDW